MAHLERFDHRPTVKKRKLPPLPENPEKNAEGKAVKRGRFPSWLHRKLPKGSGLAKTDRILDDNRLHTVCEEAKCPNLLECWSKKTATFLIMGKDCTRSCGFCDIDFAKAPKPLDPNEPKRVLEAADALGLQHVVLTMVARDDLEDGGAEHIATVVETIKKKRPAVSTEVLISDLGGKETSWQRVLDAKPSIFNHNIETVRELTPRVRHKATYERTLKLLTYAAKQKHSLLVKSGLMVGLGETEDQVKETLQDLRDAGCSIVTIGQYLQPNRNKLRVKAFVTPEQFKKYEEYGHSIGIQHMYAGPFVRSSYNAKELFQKATT